MAPRETENNTYANFWGDKQRGLWYVMVFSGVVNNCSGSFKEKNIFVSSAKILKVYFFEDLGKSLIYKVR